MNYLFFSFGNPGDTLLGKINNTKHIEYFDPGSKGVPSPDVKPIPGAESPNSKLPGSNPEYEMIPDPEQPGKAPIYKPVGASHPPNSNPGQNYHKDPEIVYNDRPEGWNPSGATGEYPSETRTPADIHYYDSNPLTTPEDEVKEADDSKSSTQEKISRILLLSLCFIQFFLLE